MNHKLKATDIVLIDGAPHRVGTEIADRYREGDLIIGISGGHLLHVPRADLLVAKDAVSKSVEAFDLLKSVSSDQISLFFHTFAQKLEDDAIFAKIKKCNEDDVASALQRSRSTTRLMLTDAKDTCVARPQYARSIRKHIWSSFKHKGNYAQR